MSQKKRKKKNKPAAKRPRDVRAMWTNMGIWLACGSFVGSLFLVEALEPLVWIAVTPPLLATLKGRVCAPSIWTGCVSCCLISLSWLIQVGYFPWLLCCFFFGFLFGFCFLGIWYVHRKMNLPMWILGTVFWLAGASLKMDVSPFSVTWIDLAYLLIEWDVYRQAAEVGGLGLLSLGPLLVGGTLADAIAAVPKHKWGTVRLVRIWSGAAAAVAVILFCSIWGIFRMQAVELTRGPRVALVQGGIPQAFKLDRNNLSEVIQRHIDLARGADLQGAEVILWPESSAEMFLEREPEILRQVAKLAEEKAAPVLVGAYGARTFPEGDSAPTNSAFLVDASGAIVGRWDKRVLVPLVETLLWIDYIPPIRQAVGQILMQQFKFFPFRVAGKSPVVEPIPGSRWSMGVAICYGDAIPWVMRQLGDGSADLLVVISNEAWFGRSHLRQHMDMARMRAIETRRPVVRAGNTGMTVAIDPLGTVTDALPPDEPGTLVTTTAITNLKPMPYWLQSLTPRLALLAAVVLFLIARRRSG